MLAELFHPGDPPLLDVRLKLVPILTPEKEALLHVELLAVLAYDKFRLDGMPAHEAREAACEVAAFTIKHGHRDDAAQHFNRRRRGIEAYLDRVRGKDTTDKN